MRRTGLCLFLCAATLLGALPLLPAAPEDEAGRKKEALLALQRALLKGREHLRSGQYKAAVDILEREFETDLNAIFENRDYLRALSEAYVGYIAELKQANQSAEAAVYQRRLARVDPGALVELKGSSPLPVVPITLPTVAAPKALLPPPPTPSSAPTTAALAMGTPAGPTGPGVQVRGQVKEEDPFDDANSKASQQARELVDRAEGEFDAAGKEKDEAGRAAHYAAAARLFEQAERALKGSTGAARERWAYCKLRGVVDALNQRERAEAPQELEREVRLALTMSPKLDAIGRDLLKRIQERQATPASGLTYPVSERTEDAPVSVKHTPRQGNSWAMAETANFRIFHVQSRETAEQAARVAEGARLSAARKWFGQPLDPWPTRCDIYIHSTGDEYAQATQQSPRCPGHSTMPMEGERVLSRRVDVHCDDPNMCVGVLPHEVTHVVLAGRFPGALPRWADEGMAVLTEPRERVERHLRNLPNHAQQGQLFSMAQLMRFDKKYPEPQLVGAFYAESVSVVDYLSRLHGPQEFSQFMADGMRGGYEAALRKHYNLQSFADLDAAWQRHAFGEDGSARVAQP
jgi:tetratricopeptide (TPR) repeat protein